MLAGRLTAMVFFLVSLKDFMFILFTHPDGPNPAGANAALIISAQPSMWLRTRKGNSYVGI